LTKIFVSSSDLVRQTNQWLEPSRFKDYCPNGLQVQGCDEIYKLVTGVTASLDLIQAAIDVQANAILVHHGLFWRGQDGTLTGWMRARVAKLINENINLIAYHLPLDAHPVYGNNAQLAIKLGLVTRSTFGEQNLGHLGEVDPTSSGAVLFCVDDLEKRIGEALGREPIVICSDRRRALRKIAWCTGGAQSWFEDSIKAGADAFITGEISEPQAHLARETGVAFLACGHHASERYGVQALGQALAQAYKIDYQFIDIDNPA
jgi:dinuclear metal center YbgI/SA1388 family protein